MSHVADLTAAYIAPRRVRLVPETLAGLTWLTKYGEVFENCTPHMVAFWPWRDGLSTRLPNGEVIDPNA